MDPFFALTVLPQFSSQCVLITFHKENLSWGLSPPGLFTSQDTKKGDMIGMIEFSRRWRFASIFRKLIVKKEKKLLNDNNHDSKKLFSQSKIKLSNQEWKWGNYLKSNITKFISSKVPHIKSRLFILSALIFFIFCDPFISLILWMLKSKLPL